MNSGPQTDSFAPAPFIPGTMVLVEVSADIHICGICKQQYSTLDSFVAHKQNGCHLGTTTSAGSVQYVEEGATPSNSTQAVTSTITTQTQTIPDYSTTNIGQPPLSHPSDHSSCVNLEVSNRLTEFSFEQSYQTYLPNSSSASQVSSLTPGPTGISLKKSKSNSTSQKKLTCGYPGCTFKTSHGNKDLDRHLRTHTGEKPFKCDICNKNFSRQDKLKMHNRSHTGEKPYKCQYCDYAAADSSSLKKHLRIHSNERPFKCQICPYASRNSSQLIIHLRSHTGDAPFQCPVCNAKFKINSDLKRHIRIHSGEKPYQCDFCDYRCAMKGNLRSHVRIKHSMENTFKCPQCEFQCGNKSTLRQHTRIHQPDKPIKCAQCSYSCSSRGSLKVHERIHSEDRPFRCKLCTFGSKQRSNLLMHLKKHHIGKDKLGGRKKGEGLKQGSTRLVVKLDAKKPFRCDLCEASFVREDSLRSHKNQHRIVSHGVEDGTLAVLQLQMHHGSQPNTASVSSHQQPRSVTTFSKAEVKIIVDHQLNSTNGIVQAAVNEHHTMRDAVVSDSSHQNIRDEVVHGNQLQLLQQVSIITSGEQAAPQNEAVVNSSLEQETVLLSPISSSAADSLHQALMQTTAVNNQSFITSSTINCSDLDGLNALIQEDSRGVTVVSSANQNDVTSSSSSITHLLFPVSSNAAT